MNALAMPADADAGLRVAESLWQRDQVAAARAMLEDMLAAEPAHVEAAMLLGKLLQGLGQLNAACDVVARLCRHVGMTAAITFRCARFIQQCQRQPLAGALCEEALARGEGSADLHVLAGNVARELGRFDAARAHYLAALAAGVDLDRWYVLGALAAIQRYETPAHEDFQRFAAHFHDAHYSLRSRATTGVGLAKAFDDLGDHARAAATLREANRLLRQAQPWSREGWNDWLQARLQSPLPQAPARPDPDFVPIFIVGLPRSGTTLVASRLACDGNIRDRGELSLLGAIADRLHAVHRMHDAHALHEAAALYRAHVIQDDPAVRWYIDKDPHNFRHLDLVAAMFPQARIIHCRRGGADTALSIWSQAFARAHYGFANDLADIADVFAGHQRLMRHWHQCIPLPICTLDYETMIADPAASLARLRQFVGLPPSLAVDVPAASTAITSASLWQARQPIYASSVGRWKHYVAHVPELRAF